MEIIEFLNARELRGNSDFDELRRRKFKLNILFMSFMHTLGYLIVAAFFSYPLIGFLLSDVISFPLQIYLPIDFTAHSRTFFVVVYCVISFAIQTSGILIITTCLFFNTMFEFVGNEFHLLGISFENVLNDPDEGKAVVEYERLIEHHQKLLE